jgi:glucans biosynthesis protein C
MTRFLFIDYIKVFGNFIRCMIHAAVPYMVTYSAMWPFDEKGSYLFDFTIFESHLFLMELFFLLTGFMFALQLSKKTVKSFIKNRIQKIVIPFILCLIIIMPFVLSFFNLKNYNEYSWMNIEQLKNAYLNAWELGLNNFFPTGHLWFLYYLIIFYAVSLLLWPYLKKISSFLDQFNFLKILLIAVFSALFSFLFMKRWIVDNPLTLIPEAPSLIHYYIFFFSGILLFYSEQKRLFLNAHKRKLLIFGIIVGFIAIVPQLFFEKSTHPYYLVFKFWAITLHVLATYALTFSIWTYFTTKSSSQRNWITYFSDANYWIYITFLPTAMLIQLCLIPLNISIYIKFIITYLLGISICLISYEYLVRYTWIGGLLHSKKIRTKKQ